jgi:hypothetical protein
VTVKRIPTSIRPTFLENGNPLPMALVRAALPQLALLHQKNKLEKQDGHQYPHKNMPPAGGARHLHPNLLAADAIVPTAKRQPDSNDARDVTQPSCQTSPSGSAWKYPSSRLNDSSIIRFTSARCPNLTTSPYDIESLLTI